MTGTKVSVLFVLCLTQIAWSKSHHHSHQRHHKSHHQNRIIGGTGVPIENYSYAASVLLNGKHVCGGAIITPEFVVTAAHCTHGHNEQTLAIRAGTALKDSGGVVKKVSVLHQHPNYVPSKGYFDISVLELDSPLTYSKTIGFVDLPYPGEEVYAYVYGTSIGWGDLSPNGQKATQLNAVDIATIDQFQCDKFYPGISYLQFCAGSSLFGGKGPCTGDSGGPFIVNNKLVGMAAYSRACAQPTVPTVFTKISTVRTFISARAGI